MADDTGSRMKRGVLSGKAGAVLGLLLISIFGLVPVALADDCYGDTYRCNVEAQRSPVVSWPRGVSSSFPTVGGTVTNDIVNSVSVLADPSNGTESGWYLGAGRNRFNPFAVHVFNGLYYEHDAASPAGNFTFQYLTRYDALGPDWEIEAINNGTVWMDYTYYNPSFVTGYAVTNVERHASTDVFSGTPTFTSLQALSSNTWSFWPAAACYVHDDTLYQDNFFTNPTKVTVTQGVNC